MWQTMATVFKQLAVQALSLGAVIMLVFEGVAQPAYAQGGGSYFAFLPLVRACPIGSLIRDGSMEIGLPNPYWVAASSQSSDILDDSPTPPAHSGSWKAWLGGSDSVTEVLSQTFTVPAGVTQVRLSYWVWVDTQDGTGADTLEVQLRHSNGNVLATLDSLNDSFPITQWTFRTVTATVTPGSTLQLAFVAQTDAIDSTSFFVDDVSLDVHCP